MESPVALTLTAALALAFVHIFAGKMRFLSFIPRSRWLSAAGGVSVAYVFLHLLPELAEAQQEFRQLEEAGLLGFTEHHVYLLALSGLAAFYGLDSLALRSRREQRAEEGENQTSVRVFWIHIVSFAFYNLLIGYLLLDREAQNLTSLVIYVFAIALHFLVNDVGLQQHHKRQYSRVGRWLISAAVLLGWGLGVMTVAHPVFLAAVLAFLSGGIVLNTLKEEVPAERESRFGAFALGLAGYAALLLAM